MAGNWTTDGVTVKSVDDALRLASQLREPSREELIELLKKAYTKLYGVDITDINTFLRSDKDKVRDWHNGRQNRATQNSKAGKTNNCATTQTKKPSSHGTKHNNGKHKHN